MQKTLTATAYKPSSPLTGSEQYIFRGQNMILEGQYPNVYYRAYSGSLDIGENAPTAALTGTISFSPSSKVVTGTTTAFLDELHLGQMIITADGEEVIVVGQLTSQTSFIADRLPLTTGAGVAADRLPVIGELNTKRFTLLRGNALHFDQGTILAVGSGSLHVNGAVLPGDSLVATRQAQIALYDSATGLYDVQSLGFDDIPTVTNADVSVIASGGTKNMSKGYYSFKVAYYSDLTSGFGNPTDTLLAAGTAGYQITVDNSTFRFDFSSDSPPSKATGYIVYASAFSGSSDISQTNSIQGGWFEVIRIPLTSLTGGGTYDFDYTDSELGTLVSFDNDNPPDAEFLGSIDLYPFLVSCNGQGVDSTGRETSTSPGPFISPAKPDNLDSWPESYKVPTAKGETIIGVVSAAGRFFVMTPNTLQAVTPTGLPAAPFTCRPFWKRGFTNPYNLIFVDDTLYGYSGKKLFRSTGTADEAQESYQFTADVEAQLAESSGGYVFLGHDPQNECICVFLSAIRQNDSGFWETDVYPWSLTKSVWMPKVVLSSTEKDMAVSGVATVNNELYFVAGGIDREPVPPTPALAGGIFCCGAECATNTNDYGPHLRGPATFATSPVRSGTYSIKFDRVGQGTPGNALVTIDATATETILVGRLYLRFASYFTTSTYVIASGLTGATPPATAIMGLAFRESTGTLHCATNIQGFGVPYTFEYAGDGFAPALNTWYRVDFQIDRNAGTVDAIITEDGSGSGTTLTQATCTAVPVIPSDALLIGTWPNNANGVMYVDDIVISNSLSDYPIGDGYTHAFIPTADGTHNISNPDQFERTLTGVDITNATTTAYQLVSTVPTATNTEYVTALTPPVITDYVEVEFGPAGGVPVPTQAPIFVSSMAAGHQASNDVLHTCDSNIQLVDGSTETEIWSHTGVINATVVYNSEFFNQPPSDPSGVWTLAKFNALRARMYSTGQADAATKQKFDGILIEAGFEGTE